MNADFEEHKLQVQKWLKIADEDLRLAEFAFEMDSNIPYRLICYHSQQCVEKYLKAMLVSELIDFPYTHSIEALLKLCPTRYNLSRQLSDTFNLSNYAVARRYPGDYENISREDALTAVESARKAKSIIQIILRENNFY